MKTFVSHLWAFACQQALACFFPVMVFAMLGISHLFAGIIPRYDFMLLACIGIQILMYRLKMETKDEILVICIFHLLGLVMELFKVYIGSWSYPEFAYAKIGGVPLYSGFMYASVASYMCQSWRRLDLGIMGWPHSRLAKVLGACIYLNFFTNHFVTDVRWVIACAVMVLFFRVWVVFTVKGTKYRMPIVAAFLLIGFFIWLAENIATGLGAWKYAYQHHGWRVVSLQKLSSWDLLVIVSFIIVAELKMLKEKVGVPMVSTPQSVGQFAITRNGMALKARKRALTIRRGCHVVRLSTNSSR